MVSTTFAPAELANSRSSSSESRKSHFETPFFSKAIRSARSCPFFGRVSIIRDANLPNPAQLRAHSEQNPCFVVTKKRQVQRQKVSLPPKPGQLPFGVTAGRLLNLRDRLRDRLFSSEQLTNFAQSDHLRSGLTYFTSGAHLLDCTALKH